MSQAEMRILDSNTDWFRVHNIIPTLQLQNKKVQIISIKASGTGSSAETEIAAPNNVFDGTTTPAVVYVVSTSANDTATGTGVQEVTLLGYDENDHVIVLPISMGGTTAQSSVTKFKRLYHAYASKTGSGNKAAGTITIQSTAGGGTIYLTIAVGYNESNGAQIWLPNGSYCSRYRVNLQQTTMAVVANASLISEWRKFGIHGDAPDLPNRQWLVNEYNPNDYILPSVHIAEYPEQIYFTEKQVTAAEDFFLDLAYVIWRDL